MRSLDLDEQLHEKHLLRTEELPHLETPLFLLAGTDWAHNKHAGLVHQEKDVDEVQNKKTGKLK